MKCMRWDPFGKSVVELLDCDQAKKIIKFFIKNKKIMTYPTHRASREDSRKKA